MKHRTTLVHCGRLWMVWLAMTILAGDALGQSFGATAHDKSKLISVLTLTANHRAVQPDFVTVAPGRYMIRLRNALTTRELSFVVQEVGRSRSARVSIGAGRSKEHRFFDLDAGQYEVLVEGYAGLRALITVRP